MRVLIIPEDFRLDQFILLPIIERMFAEIGKLRAKIEVCRDPLLGGIDQATSWDRIRDILEMNPMVDIFLLLVDRDGVTTRRRVLDGLEMNARAYLNDDRLLMSENAWQEIEVWALAGQDLPKKWPWKEIRQEVHPKEIYFLPWAEKRGLLKEPGEGRTTLGREAASNYKKVLSRCKEDVVNLRKRLVEKVNG